MMITKGFNNYFANIGPTLASKINNDNVSHCDFKSSNMNASLFLEPNNETEIKLIIHELKEGASGRDGILPKHIKSVSESCIIDCFNFSISPISLMNSNLNSETNSQHSWHWLFYWKPGKGSWWWKLCCWDFSRFPKGLWYCWSLYFVGQTSYLWYSWYSLWLVFKLPI